MVSYVFDKIIVCGWLLGCLGSYLMVTRKIFCFVLWNFQPFLCFFCSPHYGKEFGRDLETMCFDLLLPLLLQGLTAACIGWCSVEYRCGTVVLVW